MSAPPRVRVLEDAGALAHAAAALFREAAAAAVAREGRFTVALAGGETPRALYRLLADPAAPYRAAIPWERVEVFFGDERSVPAGDPRSNYGMAREALLAHVPVAPERVHRVEGERDAGEAARRYAAALVAALGPDPRLDLVLLGLGADGHTASLFPGSPALEPGDALAVDAVAPAGDRRVTLTLRALEGARRVVFVVAGAAKAPALARALAPGRDPEPVPAARVRPRDGDVLWLVDRAAAGQ